MSTLREINAVLASIKDGLDAIDLTKETDVKKIEAMGKMPINEVDKAVEREDFGESQLENVVGEFKKAGDRLATYDNSKDREEARNAKGDMTKVEAVSDRMNAKKSVQDSIKAKYEELSRKKAVIDKYKEKYDPEYLIGRQNDRVEANNKKIKDNKVKMATIETFKNSVSGELDTINNNLALIDELDKLAKLNDDVKKIEDTLNKYKAANVNEDLVADQEEELKNAKAGLKTKTAELSKKYKGVTLDPNNLTSSITVAKGVAKNSIATAKNKIENKAKSSSEECINQDIYNRLVAAKGDKEYVSVIDDMYSELGAENIDLDTLNKKISKNVETIKLGEQLRTAPPTPRDPITEPTEEEIKQYLDEHPDLTASLPALTDEAKTQKIYDSLVEGKRSQSPWLHPIAFLRARYDKGLRENWVSKEEKDLRKQASEAIKASKQAERDERTSKITAAKEKSDSRRAAFAQTLFARVMKSDAKTVEQMDKDANKAPGKVLVDVYNEIEQKEEQEEEEK